MQTVLFYTSKLLRPIFASPYFLFLFFILAAFILLPVQNWKKRAVKWTGITLVLALATLSTPAVSRALTYSWETQLGDSNALAVTGTYDAIVILGGTVDTKTTRGEQIMLGDSAERLTGAVRLFKAGIAPRILVSVGSGYVDQTVKEAPIMANILQTMG
ncbi:MAG: ElyC/SanA/YdcF family protein, partial [Treponemataceae bacterium]